MYRISVQKVVGVLLEALGTEGRNNIQTGL